MKRISRSILIALSVLLIISTIVLAAYEFRFPTKITDTSGSARTYLGVVLGYSGDSLVNAGKIAANGLDTNMQVSSANVKYTVAEGEVTAVAPSLLANSSVTIDLYTGYDPAQTALAIVPGDGGYATRADVAGMEFGSDFESEWDGYFDASVVGDLVNKNAAFNVARDGAGGITAGIATEGADYPSISSQDGASASGASSTVTYPSGLSSGDLLLIAISVRNAASAQGITPPAGFTQLYNTQATVGGTYWAQGVWYRTVDGAEGTSGVWSYAPNAVAGGWDSFRIANGTWTGTPAAGAMANGVTSVPNPPSLTSGYGAVATMWFALAGATIAQTAAPAGYSNFVGSSGGSASAQRNTVAASENPGGFDVSAASWVANTVAVKGLSWLEVSASGITSGDRTATVTGTANEPQWATGTILQFDGTANSYLDAGVVYDASAKLWLSLWFKPDNNIPAVAGGNLWGKYVDGANYNTLFFDGGALRFRNVIGGVVTDLASISTSWTAGTWYHVITSLSDANGKRLVIDDNVDDTDADLGAAVNGGDLVLGNYITGAAGGFDGVIANVVVGTDDLTVGEEADLYAGIAPGDETEYWYMDEGSGLSIPSYGSTATTGTISTGNAWATETYTTGSTGRLADFTIQVDSERWGENLKGVAVPDNANPWVFTCDPYWDYYRHTVGGALVTWYEPNTMVGGDYFAGTADAGSNATQIRDAALTQANDYWNYARVTITDTTDDLAPVGETRVVADFIAATDDLIVAAFSAAVDAGDTYRVSFGTLEDRQGANDAVLTWGTNSSLSLIYGTMSGSGSSAATSAETGGFDLSSAGLPSTWFAAGEGVTSLPFYDAILAVSLDTGQPVQEIYFLMILAFAFGIMFLLTVNTRVALLGVLGFNIVLFIGSSMTIIPMWIPFSILVVQIGILYLYKQVAY